MKLIRYGNPGQEKPGVIIDDKKYALPGFSGDYDEDFFGGDGLQKLSEYIASHKNELEELPEDVRLGAPVFKPSKIVCIGLNFADHAKETNAPIPAEPIIFFKATTALTGPNDNVTIPRNSVKTDWEVELAFVIGKKASYVDLENALDHVAGYCLHNDYSEREFQIERGGQWDKGKGCDTFAPVGPFIATADELGDVNNLHMWLTVNGKTMQNGSTSTMIFDVPFLVHYISQFMTLLPGDIVSTGTPPGVGLGMKPEPVYLKAGDVVELGIEGLGTSKQVLKAWSPPAS
ncbi:2-keto-4-pentenoate hydratase/2-oxohepta-3-ene-1,7-dioic acid hydratase (catechol pathway) [Mucilaginibacter mallensis]|uniref:2-keto-4-pentenoate hydratase/2-oxohepta-3-ene-1,7-dioic acid hydratase (Catechol pathway) n=1 Tax=Mucilaginibacter mallensis TaxID=652787 RepID=A0A1H1VNX5_MUCMA|nr:fumarylacetoacetate hydrolase family protein [Mucilaginibacter mallensis]SDS86492.1 2-keto-4-pentenoate hydratase/2-oxohepta-3-ene-1,7-dioic acid hydratase (catechol pathway) [Mucilaginibacter mallensis]